MAILLRSSQAAPNTAGTAALADLAWEHLGVWAAFTLAAVRLVPATHFPTQLRAKVERVAWAALLPMAATQTVLAAAAHAVQSQEPAAQQGLMHLTFT
jgi:hypothetical protein